MMKIILLISCFSLLVNISKTDESFCTLNGKKSLNYVSDKFISFVVEPTVLFTDLNISETAHELGKHLSPAYVRIAGSSTKYLKFSENEEDHQAEILKNSGLLIYTPSFMDHLGEWFINTNLSMIFAFNDNDRVDGRWNSKSVLPILELSTELNLNCLWQLGYDTTNLPFEAYQEDLKLLKNTLDAFPSKKNNWGIISNEINAWSQTSFEIRKNIDALHNVVKAISWRSSPKEENSFDRDEMIKVLSSATKTITPVWATLPKSKTPITFASTLTLAKQIGEAAVLGYEVVFRQPRLYELMTDTPNYWYILFHKTLMGRNVLEIKTNGIQKLDTTIYCHCTRNQNNFSRRGAITICVVNNNTHEHTTSVKLPITTMNLKHIEVQTYILTSENENSTNVYLNNQKLSMNLLKENQGFLPKLRRARMTKHLTLTLPSKSIGFFVVPDARIPICINDEDETNLIIEEIEKVEKSEIFPPKSEVESRNTEPNSTSLVDLYNEMQTELEIDQTFYRNQSKGGHQKQVNFNQNTGLLNKRKEQTKKLKEKHLNDQLLDVTSQEIEEAVLKITKTLKADRDKREARSTGRLGKGRKRLTSSKWQQRKPKRDINMELLEQKAAKEETLQEKLKKLRAKSLHRKKDLEGNHEISAKKSLQETLEELMKPKPLDLSKFLHLRNGGKSVENKDFEEEEIKEISTKDSMEYLDEHQDDYLEDLDHSFHDGYEDFGKEFGDDVKIVNRVHNEENNMKEQNKLLNKEFIINHEADDLIKKTIKNLEDYFNKANDEQTQEHEDVLEKPQDLEINNLMEHHEDYIEYDEEMPTIRRKRQEKKFTEEDIIHYKQLMNSNIRHMRDHIRKNKLKLKTPKKEQVNLGERINKLKEAVEQVQKSNGNLIVPSTKKPKFSLEKIKVPINGNVKLNHAKLLKSRLAQHKLNQNDNDAIFERQKKKEEVDDETKELIRMIKNELRNRKPGDSRRFKRYITKDKYKKYENSINSINNIVKDGEYFVPKIATNSDFTLVLPTKDEISLNNTEEASEIKLKHVVHKKVIGEKVKQPEQFGENNKTNVLNSSVTQRDYQRFSPGAEAGFDKLFDSVVEFIVNVREKVKTYLKFFDDV